MQGVERNIRKLKTIMPTRFAEFLVALSLIFISNVYSESNDCGKVPNEKHPGVLNRRTIWPWMVAITKKEKDGDFAHFCNGFLIDRKHVLTTASCFQHIDNVKDVLARIGKMNQNKGEEYEITCIIKHPNSKINYFFNDIAILTLSRDVKTPNYSPICLPDEELSKKNLDGLEATKVGWGADDEKSRVKKKLRQAPGQLVLSDQACMEAYKFLDSDKSKVLCAKNPPGRRHLCLGDSGAPLMFQVENRWTAVGISAFGYKCDDKEAPDGYTRISEYMEWIKEITENGKGVCD